MLLWRLPGIEQAVTYLPTLLTMLSMDGIIISKRSFHTA
jgi:hypothetical protein